MRDFSAANIVNRRVERYLRLFLVRTGEQLYCKFEDERKLCFHHDKLFPFRQDALIPDSSPTWDPGL